MYKKYRNPAWLHAEPQSTEILVEQDCELTAQDAFDRIASGQIYELAGEDPNRLDDSDDYDDAELDAYDPTNVIGIDVDQAKENAAFAKNWAKALKKQLKSSTPETAPISDLQPHSSTPDPTSVAEVE